MQLNPQNLPVRRVHRTVLPLLAVAAIACHGMWSPPSQAQLDPGRLTGVVVDEDGKPVHGITLRLVPEDRGSAQPKTVKVKKKNGKFTVAFLPAGRWKIEPEDPAYFLKSMEYLHRDAAGLKTGDFEAKGHPTKGLPSFRVGVNAHGHIELVIADAEYRDNLARQVKLGEASGPLKAVVSLYEAGDMNAVVEKSSKILEDSPGLEAAHYMRGSALWQLERYEEATSDLRAAQSGDKELSQVHGILGTVLIERGNELKEEGRIDEAMAHYNEAAKQLQEEIRRSPADPSFKLNLVVALDAADRREELGPALEALIEADPSNQDAAMRLADFYASEQRYDEAIALIDRLGLKDRGMANILYNVAVGHYNDGNYDTAMEYADKVREIDPGHVQVVSLVGYLRLSGGDKAAALESFREFVELAAGGDLNTQTERELIQALEQSGP